MSSEKVVEGVVKALSTKEDRYGLKLEVDGDMEWFNDFGSPKAGKGDKVLLNYERSGDWNNIIDITVLRKAEELGGVENGSGMNSGSSTEESSSGSREGVMGPSGSRSSNTVQGLSREDRIMLQVAFKKAVDQLDYSEAENVAEHFDRVKSLTNGYRNIMQDLMSDGELK